MESFLFLNAFHVDKDIPYYPGLLESKEEKTLMRMLEKGDSLAM